MPWESTPRISVGLMASPPGSTAPSLSLIHIFANGLPSIDHHRQIPIHRGKARQRLEVGCLLEEGQKLLQAELGSIGPARDLVVAQNLGMELAENADRAPCVVQAHLAAGMEGRIRSPAPVSYTHLDVYKRQYVMRSVGVRSWI